MNRPRFRAGDTVRHIPTGETWFLAGAEGDRIYWCGWPEGWAKAEDCELVKAATDEESVAVLREWAATPHTHDVRHRLAVRALAALEGVKA